mmetsp:Transcript_8002/g.15463  ORF Transcript_8002/g.15463 Transcript_8002/m.15463 type:complete len:212 (-) Transcript_8002:39-674(-)
MTRAAMLLASRRFGQAEGMFHLRFGECREVDFVAENEYWAVHWDIDEKIVKSLPSLGKPFLIGSVNQVDYAMDTIQILLPYLLGSLVAPEIIGLKRHSTNFHLVLLRVPCWLAGAKLAMHQAMKQGRLACIVEAEEKNGCFFIRQSEPAQCVGESSRYVFPEKGRHNVYLVGVSAAEAEGRGGATAQMDNPVFVLRSSDLSDAQACRNLSW